jgi:hypothetical protein
MTIDRDVAIISDFDYQPGAQAVIRGNMPNGDMKRYTMEVDRNITALFGEDKHQIKQHLADIDQSKAGAGYRIVLDDAQRILKETASILKVCKEIGPNPQKIDRPGDFEAYADFIGNVTECNNAAQRIVREISSKL